MDRRARCAAHIRSLPLGRTLLSQLGTLQWLMIFPLIGEHDMPCEDGYFVCF
uniref:Uncharacterized protein n=1 Tax=Anguilla anguilla TaxID=7936 RepID=A0A0E9Y0X2_ANGAN